MKSFGSTAGNRLGRGSAPFLIFRDELLVIRPVLQSKTGAHLKGLDPKLLIVARFSGKSAPAPILTFSQSFFDSAGGSSALLQIHFAEFLCKRVSGGFIGFRRGGDSLLFPDGELFGALCLFGEVGNQV